MLIEIGWQPGIDEKRGYFLGCKIRAFGAAHSAGGRELGLRTSRGAFSGPDSCFMTGYPLIGSVAAARERKGRT
jgi:hypothetical protein